MLARREAMAADLVVVNHHLFFADLALRDSGVAELLPTVDAAVFDEAHQLVEAGVQFLGSTPGHGAGARPGARPAGRRSAACARPAGLAGAGRRRWNVRRASCAWPAPATLRDVRGTLKLRLGRARPRARSTRRWPRLAAARRRRRRGAGRRDGRHGPDFAEPGAARRDLAGAGCALRAADASGHVRWIDLSPQQARLVESPLDIRDMLTEQRRAAPKAWIFTSATLGDDEALELVHAHAPGWRTRSSCASAAPSTTRRRRGFGCRRACPCPTTPGHPAAVGALAARCARRAGRPHASC